MKDIDNILEKYFEGESSLEEEKMLRNYFSQDEIEEHHKMYVPMFNFFTEERQGTISTTQKKKRLPLYVWISIAASLLLLLTVKSVYTNLENEASRSLVYIDGKRITNIQTINSEALTSLENISEMDEDVVDSQIGILDSFTD